MRFLLQLIWLVKKARAQQALDPYNDRHFRSRITRYATTKSPATAYNASKPGKPKNPPAADAAADTTAPLVTFFFRSDRRDRRRNLPPVTFLIIFVAACPCANATVDPAMIERITNVAKKADKSFLVVIFHLQEGLSSGADDFLYVP